MNTENLLKLASLLDTVPDENFQYATWASEGATPEKLCSHECGTTACALGWATTIPEFNLRLRMDDHRNTWVEHASDDSPCSAWEAAIFAADRVFGIDEEETAYLFAPEDMDRSGRDKPRADAPPKEVADHIRSFVSAGGIP